MLEERMEIDLGTEKAEMMAAMQVALQPVAVWPLVGVCPPAICF